MTATWESLIEDALQDESEYRIVDARTGLYLYKLDILSVDDYHYNIGTKEDIKIKRLIWEYAESFK
jgi:hypothetical protein